MVRSARAAFALVTACWVLLPGSAGAVGEAARASTSAAGGQADDESTNATISADGRYVVFDSAATTLVPGDTNASFDIFRKDRVTGSIARVSVSSSGAQADADSFTNFSAASAVSADGVVVAFASDATNLVAGDSNGVSDVFVRDVGAGTTARASVGTGGGQADGDSVDPSLSADGRYVAFESVATTLTAGDTNAASDIFVRDRQTGTTERVSVATGGAQGDAASYFPSISSDGRYVAFYSHAATLVAGDTNGAPDVFVRDRQTGTTARASISTAGAQAGAGSFSPTISGDGRLVAFESVASNLVAGDTNGAVDVFVRDLLAGTTARASVASDGAQANGDSTLPAIAHDGAAIAFTSEASNLVAGDTATSDVFVHYRATGSTIRASRAPAGSPDGPSYGAAVSIGGDIVAYESAATNLVPGDTNNVVDVFAASFEPGTPAITSPAEGAATDANPVPVSGTADPGATVRVYEGTTQLAQVTADGAGAWTATVALGEGTHTIVARAIDLNGEPGATSGARTFVVDRTAPGAPAIATPAEGSTATSPTVAIAGSAQPGATVRVFEGTAQVGATQAGGGGAWSVTASFLNGAHTVTARATDAAGNAGPSSAPRTFLVDAPAPPAPTIEHPLAGSIHDAVVTFDGAAPGATEVRLYESGAEIARVPASGGTWAVDVLFTGGTHSVVARAVASGVVGPPSETRAFTVDASPPRVAFTTTTGDQGFEVSLPGSGMRGTATDDVGVARLEIVYRDRVGSEVARAEVTCTGCPGSSVTWRHDPDLLPGLYSVTVRAYDLVGNTAARSIAAVIV